MKTFNETEKDQLLSLCTPDSETVIRLLKDGHLGLAYQARLGNENAEKEIIAKYDTTTDFLIAEKSVEELGICGSLKCIDLLIKSFNRPLYFFKDPRKQCKTLRVSIVRALQRYYPSEELLNKKYLYMAGFTPHNFYDLSDTTKTKPYIDSLISWFDKTYHVKPDDPIGKYIFLNEWCGPNIKEDKMPPAQKK